MKGKSFPKYDRLAMIIGKDRAKGNLDEDPTRAHVALDHPEGENCDDEVANGVSQTCDNIIIFLVFKKKKS